MCRKLLYIHFSQEKQTYQIETSKLSHSWKHINSCSIFCLVGKKMHRKTMTFKQWLYKFFTYLTQILKFSLAEVPHWKMLVLLIFHINFLCKLSHAFYVLCIFLLTGWCNISFYFLQYVSMLTTTLSHFPGEMKTKSYFRAT